MQEETNRKKSVSERGRMPSGSSILRSLSWPGRSKKRPRSGSGGSQDGRKQRSPGLSLQSLTSLFSSKEQLNSPNQTIQLKCSWPVEMLKDGASGGQGFDSKHFKTKINGVSAIWNLSIRFWNNDHGEKIFNPFILCLNIIECKSTSDDPVELTYKINMFNRESEKFDEGTQGVTSLLMNKGDQIQSVVVENITLSDIHYNDEGGALLQACLSFNCQPRRTQNIPKYVSKHSAQPDLHVVCENRVFPVHKDVLVEVSPVLASLVEGLGKSYVAEEVLISEVNTFKSSDDKLVDKIVIPDLDDTTVDSILRYIYTGDAHAAILSSPKVLKACILYQLDDLQALCEAHLATLLSPTNVSSLLLLADSCSSSWLKERALEYCREQCAYIIKDQEWTNMEHMNNKLWVEACKQVEVDTCKDHGQCVKNTRYLMETKMKEQCAR